VKLRIVCIGDIHLGRAPSRMPDDPALLEACSPHAAFRKAVAFAVRARADLVLLAGDSADRDNAFFEAYSRLAEGVHALGQAGIPVYAVAGNHDYELLPAIAKEVANLTVLGCGGWEERLHFRDGTPALRLQGRSFTSSAETGNPLENYPAPAPDLPTLALLHCDVDNMHSNYFPVSSSELKLRAPAAWVLGHVHKPQVLQRDPLILYPGSLQALDPGEQGPHGLWMLELDGGRVIDVQLHPLAPLRYEEITIGVDQAESAAAVRVLILQELKRWEEAHAAELAETRKVCCRLRLSGATGLMHEMPRIAEGLREEAGSLDRFFFDQINIDCRPRLPLEAMAAQGDPAGLLAAQLLLLQRKEPRDEYQRLLAQAGKLLEGVQQRYAGFGLESAAGISEHEAAALLYQAGLRMLEELHAQKEPER